MAEPRFDPLLKTIDDIYLATSGHKDHRYLHLCKHVQNFVQQHLLAVLHVVLNILKNEEDGAVAVLGEVVLQDAEHLVVGVHFVVYHFFGDAQSLEEGGGDALLLVVENGVHPENGEFTIVHVRIVLKPLLDVVYEGRYVRRQRLVRSAIQDQTLRPLLFERV